MWVSKGVYLAAGAATAAVRRVHLSVPRDGADGSACVLLCVCVCMCLHVVAYLCM